MTGKASVEVIQPGILAGVVADEIVASVQDAIADHGRCSLVLAGGRTPGAIYRMLAIPPRVSDIDWSKVWVYWGDERWVPRDDNQSNYRMVDETLLSRIPGPRPKLFSVDTSLASPQAGAERYAGMIAEAEGLAPGQLPTFDLVLLGIGVDGHTASVFPHSEVLTRANTIAHAVKFPGGGMRVTLSPDALFSARKILFIATGDHKADVVKRVLEGAEDVSEVPAKLYLRAEERVAFFLGSNAARKLEQEH